MSLSEKAKATNLITSAQFNPGESDSCMDAYDCWKRWCRLCAKEDPCNIDVFNYTGKEILDTTLATAIGKYFWINIKSDDTLPHFLCKKCDILVNSLCSFTERINKVQTMFALLQNASKESTLDPNEMRLQYGIIDDDRHHIISSPVVNAEEYFIELQEGEQAESDMENRSDINPQDIDEEYENTNDYYGKYEMSSEIMQTLNGNSEFDVDSLENDKSQDIYVMDESLSEVENDTVCKVKKLKTLKEHKTEAKNKNIISNSGKEFEDEIRKDFDMLSDVVDDDDAVECNGEQNNIDNKIEVINVEIKAQNMSFYSENDGNEPCIKIELNKNHGTNVESEQQEKEEEEQVKEEEETAGQSKDSVVIIDGIKIVRPQRRKPGRPAKANHPSAPDDAGGDGDDLVESQYKFECNVCPKKYKNLAVYRKHMQDLHQITDLTVVEYKCTECSKVFRTKRHLSLHKRTHLPLEMKQIYPCPYCEKRFTKTSILAQHISGTHLNEKPYMCEECGRVLKTLAALKEHKLIHTDDCPFECEVCHRKFKNKARLKLHSDIHTDTIYKCTICGLQLNTRRTFNMHKLVHSEVKAYKCDYCGSEFKRSKAYKNHLIIHTGLRPYICNFCDKAFTNGSNCRAHKKKAHPAELAALEAEGKSVQPIVVPELNQLRVPPKKINKLRPPKRKDSLPSNWRELLQKAEERANQFLEKQKQSTAFH